MIAISYLKVSLCTRLVGQLVKKTVI